MNENRSTLPIRDHLTDEIKKNKKNKRLNSRLEMKISEENINYGLDKIEIELLRFN